MDLCELGDICPFLGLLNQRHTHAQDYTWSSGTGSNAGGARYFSFTIRTPVRQPRAVTDDELKRLYRAAALRHHPDVGGDGAMMQRVNRAYERRDAGALRSLAEAERGTDDTGTAGGGRSAAS